MTDEQLHEAATAPVRRPRWSLRADWDRDGTFGHELSDLTDLAGEITVERSRESKLPGVGIPNGSTAASLSTTLAGRWDPTDPGAQTVAEAFAPYRTDAALFDTEVVGTPLVFDSGLATEHGPREERQFTGYLSRYVPRSKDRTVPITALDGSAQMRAPIQQPPWGMDSLRLNWYGPDRYNSRINSQWLFDRVFRANGYFASPEPQPDSFLSVTMHGSSIPEIGTGGIPQQVEELTPSGVYPWTTVRHPYGMLWANPFAPSQTGYWFADQYLTMEPGDGVACSFIMMLPNRPVSQFMMGIAVDGGPVDADIYAVAVNLVNGIPAMLVVTPSSPTPIGVTFADLTVPRVPTAVHIGMHWGWRKGKVEMSLALNGVTYPPSIQDLNIGAVRSQAWAPSTRVQYELGVPMSNICWWRGAYTPERWYGASHTPTAEVDVGANELYGIPQLADVDGFDLVKDWAGVELGRVGRTKAGEPYFRSRNNRKPRGTPQRLTAKSDLADLTSVVDEASVRNSISSATTPLLAADFEPAFTATEPDQFECGPGMTTFFVNLPADTVEVDPIGSLQLPGEDYWNLARDEPSLRGVWIYCCVYSGTSTVLVPQKFISVRHFPLNSGQLAFRVYNSSGQTIRFATETKVDSQTGERTLGQAAFRIPGRTLKPAATVPRSIRDPGSIAKYGERTFALSELGGEQWQQYGPSSAGIGEAVLSVRAYPTPVLDSVEVRHDPLRDLDDPVIAVDPTGLGEVPGTIDSLTQKFPVKGVATETARILPLAPPRFGVLNDEQYGRINRTLRFGP